MGSNENRPNNREVENEMVRKPDTEGKPPKPATEPGRPSEEERDNR